MLIKVFKRFEGGFPGNKLERSLEEMVTFVPKRAGPEKTRMYRVVSPEARIRGRVNHLRLETIKT